MVVGQSTKESGKECEEAELVGSYTLLSAAALPRHQGRSAGQNSENSKMGTILNLSKKECKEKWKMSFRWPAS